MHRLFEQREQYIKTAFELTPAEQTAIVEMNQWLPDSMIDVHAHSNLPEHVNYIPETSYNHMISTFPSFSIEESQAAHALFHPDKNIRSLRFAKTFRGIAHRAANDYLLNASPATDRVALFGLPEDPDYTISMLDDQRISALKMYYSYVVPTAKTIYQTFSKEILNAAESKNIPIILHVPKIITQSVDDVLQMQQDYPDLRVSIAHLGSTKFDIDGLQSAYSRVEEETNVLLDTALNPSTEVATRALATFGPERLMYGSDEPLNMLRSVPYIHPENGQRIATEFPYHWQEPTEHAQYKHLAAGAIHSHWSALGAVRHAVEILYPDEPAQNSVKQQIFHDNAARFFGFELTP